MSLAFLGAIGTSLGSIVAGRLADAPSWRLVVVFGSCVIGAALADLIARILWAAVVDRAEGRLRADLLEAALGQRLTDLGETAVGEILDRIDDDTHEVGTLLRMNLWGAIRTTLTAGPLWLVAGFTWWPAFFMFPVTGFVVWLAIRKLLPEIAERKVVEEAAWSDHAAVMEEGVAGRDDLRTSLGQPRVLRAAAERCAEIYRRMRLVLDLERVTLLRSGLILAGVLAATAVVGVGLVSTGHLATGQLVTLFLATSIFIGQLDQLAHHLPDLQAGLGAVIRLRTLLAVEPEPVGGRPIATQLPSVEFRNLHFAYEEGRFALNGVSLTIPAGTTCALVGRSGSGKSTLASLLSRAVEPEPGSVLLDGVDVLDLDLQQLRATVGVVTQRTELLAGTLAENIALFADLPRARIEAAIDELALTAWVAGLPDGLDTVLGPGGASLSAGEQQLVAFARLLVRDVSVVVLDEATARMDALTESRVVRAADRLLTGRTGILIAHRLSTTERADQVAVLADGRVLQEGPRSALAVAEGPFRDLLAAASEHAPVATTVDHHSDAIGTVRLSEDAPAPPDLEPPPSLAAAVLQAIRLHPEWGLLACAFFTVMTLTGAYGAATGFAWGHTIAALQAGQTPIWSTAMVVACLLIAPVVLSQAIARYPLWWISVSLRVRMSVLAGQTEQHRLLRTPPGEVVSRSLDSDRYVRYVDRWVDVCIGSVTVLATAIAAGTPLAGAVLLAVMVVTALVATAGRPIAGRSATASSSARATFGRYLVAALESARTVKLAAATPAVHRHLRSVDSGRVDAAVREHRVQAVLDGLPTVLVQCGAVAAWSGLVSGTWGLATAILIAGAVNGFDYFGKVAGAVITEAPGVRSWLRATSEFAGGGSLVFLPQGVDLVHGAGPTPHAGTRDPLRSLQVSGLAAVHEDGTVGVRDVDLEVSGGELVLLLGPVGAGKSSLLSALAGLMHTRGSISWNGRPIQDAEVDLRPGRVAHVAQVPRVLSGTWRQNVVLDHEERHFEQAAETARLSRDIEAAGGADTIIGHRGVRLSGGQVQRLALARALACDAELLLADDVSSALDAATEVELWRALRQRGSTVLGATSKVAALEQADRVLVLVDGRVAASGPWDELAPSWSHLAG